MKRVCLLSIIILLAHGGCKQIVDPNEDLLRVEVMSHYPKKELILQDFMDVEYIPLETKDDFTCQGLVLAISKELVLIRNFVNDGDIFVYDRKTGKGVKKINRKGGGSEEYTFIQRIVLDEERDEIFIHDHLAKKIIVYDLDGNFKRSFHSDDLSFAYMYDFDSENLICNNYWVTDKLPFTLISKQDGSITQQINLPFKEKKSLSLSYKDEMSQMTYSVLPRTYNPIIPNFGSWILVEQSSDTVYKYQPDHTMTPIIVRTPSVQSMQPEVFLFLSILTERYYFMEAVKKEYDFQTGIGFPSVDLLYDKKERSMYEYIVYNDDYLDKTPVNIKTFPVNNEIAFCQSLEAPELVEAYKKGKLSGPLKEIAAHLNEESNPVLMIGKYKKEE